MNTRVRSPRVKLFVQEYVWGKDAFNGAKCALAAGFSKRRPDEARKYAYQLLHQKSVKELIEKESAEKERQFKQKAVRVVEEVYAQSVARLSDAYDESGNLRPMKDWPDELRRALAGCDTEIIPALSGEADDGHYDRGGATAVLKLRLVDKRASQELFLKYAGKLKDKVEYEGTVEVLIREV